MYVPSHTLVISIHTPTKGATFYPLHTLYALPFQSTLPRRERRKFPRRAFSVIPHFNPHSHEGSDQEIMTLFCFSSNFNPHSHEGSDLTRSHQIQVVLMHFNPHSHEGSDFVKTVKNITNGISIHTPTKGATNQRKF